MSNHIRSRLLGGAVAAFTMVSLCGAAEPAKKAPAEKASTSAASGKMLVGPGSISGSWVKLSEKFGDRSDTNAPARPVLKTMTGETVPMQPWASEIAYKRLKDAAAGFPFASTKAKCLPDGVPDMILGPGPWQILESPGQVTILREVLTYFRTVRLNAGHEDDPDPTYNGDSVGHWEGDTLVIDTVGLTTNTTVDGVIPHTDKLHVVERLRPTGKDTMDVMVTIEDPGTFTKPWSKIDHYKRLPGGITEYLCENQRNFADASGKLSGNVSAAKPQGN